MQFYTAFCLSSVIVVGLSAQSTLLVGPGGYAQIADAVAAASPGDNILVQSGSYHSFSVERGLTIRGLGTVQIYGGLFSPQPFCSFDLPAGHELHLTDIQIRSQVLARGGRFSFDQCNFWVTASLPAVSAVLRCEHAIVHLQDCEVRNAVAVGGSGHALHLVNCDTTASNCRLMAEFHSAPVAATASVTGGRLLASACRFHGSSIVAVSSEVLKVEAGATASLVDCTLGGGDQNTCFLAVQNAQVNLTRTVVPQQLSGCGSGTVVGNLLGVKREAPFTVGNTFALDATGPALGLVSIWAATRLGRLELPGTLAQPFWLDQASSFMLSIYSLDAGGGLRVAWPIPANPSLVGIAVWLQAIGGPPTPIPTSVVLGGTVR